MRRKKVSLYIGGSKADLSDDSFVLYNYAVEDLTDPTVVRNAFSSSVELPGTPANNKIFGQIWKMDRYVDSSTSAGHEFDPSRRMDFLLYSEDTGDLLESGYLKLDAVTREGRSVTYSVTLYGGLGSFLYGLSADSEGNALTLADLEYEVRYGDRVFLDAVATFTINATTVKNAWKYGGGTPRSVPVYYWPWLVINFAPCYNGIPDGDFDANKGVVSPADIGLAATVDGYTTKNGKCLVTLADKKDEWAVKDLRSYLQRPVISMKYFLNAVCLPRNNGGWTVDASAVSSLVDSLWLTLPLLPYAGTYKQIGSDITVSAQAVTGNIGEMGQWWPDSTLPKGTDVTLSASADLYFSVPSGVTQALSLQGKASKYSESGGRTYRTTEDTYTVIVFGMVAYNSSGNIVGCSKVRKLGVFPEYYTGGFGGLDLNAVFGDDLEYDEEEYNSAFTATAGTSETLLSYPDSFNFEVTAHNAAYFKLRAVTFGWRRQRKYIDGSLVDIIKTSQKWTAGIPFYYTGESSVVAVLSTSAPCAPGTSSIRAVSSSSVRSGAKITPAMLLGGTDTPADYLLSLCKTFGWYILADSAAKTAQILRRNDFYEDRTIDLSERIDTASTIEVTPLAFDARVYEMKNEVVEGEFASQYAAAQGMEYGCQRINTGYDFDAETKQLGENIVFRSAVSSLKSSKYNNRITLASGKIQPSPFLDKGCKYTLWDSSGNSKDIDISVPPNTATVEYFNDLHGYDKAGADKLDLCDADGKRKDGENILVYRRGSISMPGFRVTDDTDDMETLNDGVPCWDLTPAASGTYESLPVFSRYGMETADDVTTLTEQLDFGTPKELNIPNVVIDKDKSVYKRFWKSYIADRYDKNTRVMSCKVRLNGLRVGYDLFRCFWYYDGALWVLSKIDNWSLTTDDLAECEFVRVQDKAAYLSGQWTEE